MQAPAPVPWYVRALLWVTEHGPLGWALHLNGHLRDTMLTWWIEEGPAPDWREVVLQALSRRRYRAAIAARRLPLRRVNCSDRGRAG